MARSAARCALVSALLAGLMLAAPSVFVPAPRANSQAVMAGVAGSLVATPAWAYSSDVVDAQLLLARIPGGKFTKEKQLVVPAPEDDGFSDAQVATCLLVALLAGLAAWDLAKGMERGIRPSRSGGKGKGNLTPLVKRFIEMGY
eukprot:CAMPEP_0171094086 /NCGR_PEP_ID=MMETSP0766_2-20121228/39863_1 /TAXON_ID=439317 /ORGANISM="Gambierdiscus australes, Strain CAWD 149" /LENGTH=143 /DNA_ID=CAMNT_0011552641 /DNA_START=52 /DNA_END=483 /DNA_ORIENTATION=+